MERLTEKRDGKAVIPLRNAVCGVDMPRWCISKESDIQSFLSGDAADRLAAYEDARLEPEEITANYQTLANIAGAVKSIGIGRLVELAEADKDGRCVVLSEPMVSLMVSDDDNDSDVYCPKCDIETPMFYDANGAVKAWNRRAERTGRWVPVVNTWTQDEHEYGATWYKCDQCGRLCETKQPYCHCGAHMIEGEEHD